MTQRVFPREAERPMYLVSCCRRHADGLVRAQLCGGNLERCIPDAGSDGSAAASTGGRCGFCTEDRELLLYGLELADWAPELLALQRIRDRAFERRLERASDLRGACQGSVSEQTVRFGAARRCCEGRRSVEAQVVTRLVGEVGPLLHARIGHGKDDDVRTVFERDGCDDVSDVAPPRDALQR